NRLPRLFRGEGEHRRENGEKAREDVEQGRLRAAPARVTDGPRVKRVFERIEVEARHRAFEFDDAQVGVVNLTAIVRGLYAGDESVGDAANQSIDRLHCVASNDVAAAEVFQITEYEANAVAQVAIDAADLLDDVGAEAHVVDRLDRRRPKPQHVGAPTRHRFAGVDAGAARLRHRPALLVVDPAILHHALVRRTSANCDGGDQGTAEPSAELIAAFDNQIAGPRHSVAAEYGQMRD